MASEVSICNLALQKLGATRIASLTDDSRNARSCNAAYEHIRDVELADHDWNFARARTTVAADATAPAFGYAYSYTLPADCLQIRPDNSADLDWQIEGNNLLTNWGAPLELVYTRRVEDPNLFHRAFIEALACRLAIHMCDEITQSNQKLANLDQQYTVAIRDAKKANAFAKVSQEFPEDSWLAARR